MSRLAKKPIAIPPKTEVSFSAGVLTVKGPLGTLTKTLRPYVNMLIDKDSVTITPVNDTLATRAMIGTYAAHLRNMLAGVNKEYEKRLVIEGIGYKADVKGTDVVLAVGFSHLVTLAIPSDVKVTTEKNTIIVSGIDRDKVGQFAANIRSSKKPEPYLGKGIHYSDEVVRRKQGKKAA